MMFGVRMELRATGDDVSKSFEAVVDAYYALEQTCPELLDCGFGYAGQPDGSAHIDVELTVDAETAEHALMIGSGSVRSAIQAAGGFTPGWGEVPAGTAYRLAVEDVHPILIEA